MVALEIIASVISDTWRLFTGLTIPGIGISYAAWLLSGLLISLTLVVIRDNLGIGKGSGGSGYRSGKPGKKNISKERKNDEK